MRALNIAATGMAAQNMRVEVISNNLANMSTTAYNARRAEFSDLHYQQVQRPGTINSADGTVLPAGVQLGLGVRAAAVSMQVAQGALTETGGSLDLAIDGQGYLEVTLPARRPGLYPRRRAEAQRRRADRHLRRLPGGARHHHPRGRPPDHHQRRRRGLRLFRRPDRGPAPRPVHPTSFSNEKGLEAMGSNLYRETEASGAANTGGAGEDGRGTFRQGYLENSSVDAVHEITGLIEAQRGYELNAKVITAADQMLAATGRSAEPMARATALFLLFVAVLSAGAVLAQSVTPVRTIRSQSLLAAEDLTLAEEACRAASPRSTRRSARRPRSRSTPAGRPFEPTRRAGAGRAQRHGADVLFQRPLQIVTEGRALDRAAAGEPVRVMNLASRQTVTGTVAPDGSIEVGRNEAATLPRLRRLARRLRPRQIGQPPEMTSIGRAEDNAPPILTAERAALAVPPPQPARYAYQQASLWDTAPTASGATAGRGASATS